VQVDAEHTLRVRVQLPIRDDVLGRIELRNHEAGQGHKPPMQLGFSQHWVFDLLLDSLNTLDAQVWIVLGIKEPVGNVRIGWIDNVILFPCYAQLRRHCRHQIAIPVDQAHDSLVVKLPFVVLIQIHSVQVVAAVFVNVLLRCQELDP
jgi:hypothetical protein